MTVGERPDKPWREATHYERHAQPATGTFLPSRWDAFLLLWSRRLGALRKETAPTEAP